MWDFFKIEWLWDLAGQKPLSIASGTHSFTSQSLCVLWLDVMWGSALSTCLLDFPIGTNSILDCELRETFLPYVALVKILYHNKRKRNKYIVLLNGSSNRKYVSLAVKDRSRKYYTVSHVLPCPSEGQCSEALFKMSARPRKHFLRVPRSFEFISLIFYDKKMRIVLSMAFCWLNRASTAMQVKNISPSEHL